MSPPHAPTTIAGVIWLVSILFGIAMVVLTIAAALQGWGVVPWRRRLWVALLFAAFATVPTLPTLLGVVIGRGCGVETMEENGTWVAVEDPIGPPDLLIAICAWLMVLVVTVKNLRLPGRLGQMQRLPVVDDPELVGRISELAAKMKLPAPRVVAPSLPDHGMPIGACTGGLLAPVVIVMEGVLHRLSKSERDAIVAHELAHVARATVFRIILTMAGAMTVAVVVSGFVPSFVALLWSLAAFQFALALLRQHEELAADGLAARCLSYTVVAAALDKTHADNLQADSSPWFHALLSHPALAVRTMHLAAAAPPGEHERIAVDAALARRCVRVRRLVLAIWALLLIGSLALGALPGYDVAALAVIVPLLVVPFLPFLRFVRLLRWSLPFRPATRLRTLGWFLFAAACFLLVAVIADIGLAAGLALDAAVLTLGVLVLGSRRRRVQRELDHLLMRRDLRGFLQRCARLPPRWRKRPAHRVQVANVRAATGERSAACADLLALHAAAPRRHHVTIAAIVLLRGTDPTRALELAQELAARLPGNPLAEGLLAGVLRYAGRLDEAWQRIRRVRSLLPKEGRYAGVAARIAVARGDMAAAAAQLADAERFAPGDPVTVLARAEYEVRSNAPTAAAAVQRLRELLAQIPLEFFDSDLDRLEHELSQRPSSAQDAGPVRG